MRASANGIDVTPASSGLQPCCVLSSWPANASCVMTRTDNDFERKMAIAREVMEKHKVTLSVLAKGENSPYWTDEFAAEIEAAKARLAPYTIAGRSAK